MRGREADGSVPGGDGERNRVWMEAPREGKAPETRGAGQLFQIGLLRGIDRDGRGARGDGWRQPTVRPTVWPPGQRERLCLGRATPGVAEKLDCH